MRQIVATTMMAACSSISRILALGVVAGASVAVIADAAAQTPARPPLARGTASISGAVLEGNTAAPVASVTVSLVRHGEPSPGFISLAIPNESNVVVTSSSGDEYRSVMADARGRFAFVDLPPGRYTIRTELQEWVSLPYDASRGEEAGTGLELGTGQRANVTFRMSPYPTISGHIRDETGTPVPGAVVGALRWGLSAGRRELQTQSWGIADSHGDFSMTVPPGDYLVAASADQVRMGSWSASKLPKMSGFRRTFYPDAHTPFQAETVTVTPSIHRSGVDIQLVPEPIVRLIGQLKDTSGTGIVPTSVSLVPREGLVSRIGASVDRQGRFMFDRLLPGEYLIEGESSYDSVPRPTPKTWLRAMVTVGEVDSEVTIDVHRAFMIRGRVEFEGDAPPAGEMLRQIGLFMLPPASEGVGDSIPAHPAVQADGTFAIELPAGRYLASVEVGYESPLSGSRPSQSAFDDLRRWVAQSMTTNGRDVLSVPMELTSDVSDMVLTFRRSRSSSSLSGHLTGDSKLWPSTLVILVPADPSMWVDFGPGQRLHAVRPETDGTFQLSASPGDYYVAAVRGIPARDWRSADLFAAVVPLASALTLVDGVARQVVLDPIVAPRLPPPSSMPLADPSFETLTKKPLTTIDLPVREGAVISGRVIAADSGQGVAGVRIGTTQYTPGVFDRLFGVYTDDDGRFVLERVSAGSRTLYATKAGWAATSTARSSRMPMQLTADARVDNVTIVMTPASEISGTIQDDRGRLLVGAPVQVWTLANGLSQASATRRVTANSDGEGHYRIEGLAAGRYYLSASGLESGSALDIHVTTQEDLDYAAGIRKTLPSSEPRARAHVPVFYPAAKSFVGATPIVVGGGDVYNADFTLRDVELVTVGGSVRMPSGAAPASSSVHLVPTEPELARLGISPDVVSTQRDGTFRIPHVTPGRYLLGARVDGATTALEGFAGYREVNVGEQDDTDLVIDLRPGATITGQVTIDGAPPPPGTQLIVDTSKLSTPIDFAIATQTAPLDEGGHFSLVNVLPGTHRLFVRSASRSTPHVTVSQMVDGRETVDAGLEVTAGQKVSDVRLAVASAPASLTGIVRTAEGQPIADSTVLLFPASASIWLPKSPRMLSAQTNQSGRYEFSKIPPCDYRVVVIGRPPDEPPDATTLRGWSNAATAVTLKAGVSTTVELMSR